MSSSRPRPRHRGPAALSPLERRLLPRAAVTLALSRLRLGTSGYGKTRHGLAGPDRPLPADADERVEASVRVITALARRRPLRSACLPRSVALWALLRHQGIDSDVVIGVRPGGAPLDAHAWVERAGVPLNETPAVVATYARMEPGAPGEPGGG